MQRLGFLYAGRHLIPNLDEPLDSERLGRLLFCIRHEGYGCKQDDQLEIE